MSFGQGANVSMESDAEDACFGSHLEGMSSGVLDRSCSAPNSDGSAKAGQGERRRKRHSHAREGTPSGEGSVDVAHGFLAPVEFDFRICVPLRFCLRYRRLRRSLLTQGKEVEENDADSWRHGSLHAVDERAQRHTRRGTKDAHVASLDERLARELRDHTRCCTRVQCQGRGCGLEKSNIDCEEHQYLNYQLARGKITA